MKTYRTSRQGEITQVRFPIIFAFLYKIQVNCLLKRREKSMFSVQNKNLVEIRCILQKKTSRS